MKALGKKGDRYRGFTVVHATKIDEIGVHALELVHEATGARVVHILTDDEENVFALTFKTYPKDNTGIAHILEHTTLCGSQKYPVHDPFFLMIRRSSNTFMNAFTAKLWTCYTAASKITKDYYNLLEVYLDAVFHPLLKKVSFEQEGHRPEIQNGELVIQGVVYNEMKGVLSNPSSLFWRKMVSGLSPHHTYGYDSGGDPEAIPDLTHEALIKFHEEYYHPSRCIFYFYGNIPTENHLDFIGSHILDKADSKKPVPPVAKQTRFKEPKREIDYYPTHESDLSKKTIIGFSWLTMDIEQQEDLLALMLIDSILMETDASLLKHKLLMSNLCIAADASYDPDARDIPFSIVCRGCDHENADALEKVLFDSLHEIVSNTIPLKLIEAAMHTLEFTRSEISSSGEPYGLNLWGRTILSYLQGGPLFEGLKIHSHFEKLQKLVKDPKYLPSIIEKYLIRNPHMYRLTMIPDPKLSERVHNEELARLAKKKAELSKQEIKAIEKETRILEEYQEKKHDENADCLPLLALSDIPDQVSYFPLTKNVEKGLAVYHHGCFTNQILYADLVFDLPQIEEEDLPYLRLLGSCLTELGAGGRNYIDNLNYIHSHLGGVWTSIALNVKRENIQTCYPTISISGKCLGRKSKEMFRLMKDFVLSVDFRNLERIKELVLQSYSSLQHRLNNNAASYALKESAASFSPWNHVSNIWYGLPFFKFLESLTENIEENLPLIAARFAKIYQSIFHLNNPHLLLSCDDEMYAHLRNNDFYDFTSFAEASGPFHPWIELAHPESGAHTAKLLASAISHNAESLSTITMISKGAAPLKLASYLFENTVIHNLVRERGGAYSSGVKYNILTGIFQFYSSRDPHIASTYSAFYTAVEQIADGFFTDQDLHEAKLNYIQDVDATVSPGIRASLTYFQHKVGLSREIRQAFRNQILSATKKEVSAAVAEFLLPKIKSSSIRTTYTSKELLDKENHLPPFTISAL